MILAAQPVGRHSDANHQQQIGQAMSEAKRFAKRKRRSKEGAPSASEPASPARNGAPGGSGAPSEVPPGDRDVLEDRDVLGDREVLGGRDAPRVGQRQRRAWAPDGDDHLIYQWVKLDGKRQEYVAGAFGISQATVSRVIQRYERWQAHTAEREDGRLDPAERLRAQQWLAFERNEKMLTSCLRLAGEMEGFKDVSKSVINHPASDPAQEREVRTEWSVLDRTGMAARFLRLAFRINIEQLKLAEAAPAPLPTPLSEQEIAEQEAQAAQERDEIAAVRKRNQQGLEATCSSIMDQLAAAQCQAKEALREAARAREEAEAARSQLAAATGPLAPSRGSGEETTGSRSDREEPGAPDGHAARSPQEGALPDSAEHNLHNLHTENGAKSGASDDSGNVCVALLAPGESANAGLHRLPGSRCGEGDFGAAEGVEPGAAIPGARGP